MTEEEKKLMKQFGITVEQKSFYIYKGCRYDRLKDALSYARIETDRRAAASEAFGTLK